jgi:shikimate kinase
MDAGSIFLVGMMGAGKTTIGRALAQRLRRPFVDTDRILVERTGVPIATIFEIEGEAGFRRRESAVLAEVAHEPGRVVATGGGIVLDPANRELMRAHGTVLYLRARVDSLWERLRHDTTRPLLATPQPREKLAGLLDQRDPLYREAAHLIVDTGPQSAANLVNRIVAALETRQAASRAP